MGLGYGGLEKKECISCYLAYSFLPSALFWVSFDLLLCARKGKITYFGHVIVSKRCMLLCSLTGWMPLHYKDFGLPKPGQLCWQSFSGKQAQSCLEQRMESKLTSPLKTCSNSKGKAAQVPFQLRLVKVQSPGQATKPLCALVSSI